MSEKPKVGDLLVYRNSQQRGRFWEYRVRVVRVGRKYFWVERTDGKPDWSIENTAFQIDNGREKPTGFGSGGSKRVLPAEVWELSDAAAEDRKYLTETLARGGFSPAWQGWSDEKAIVFAAVVKEFEADWSEA